MNVRFAPNNYDGPSGTVSFASWSNPDLLAAIRQAFHESPRERITEIIVERDGIKAVFEPKNTSFQCPIRMEQLINWDQDHEEE